MPPQMNAKALLAELGSLQKSLSENPFYKIGNADSYNRFLEAIKVDMSILRGLGQYGKGAQTKILSRINRDVGQYRATLENFESGLKDSMKKVYERPTCTKPGGSYD